MSSGLLADRDLRERRVRPEPPEPQPQRFRPHRQHGGHQAGGPCPGRWPPPGRSPPTPPAGPTDPTRIGIMALRGREGLRDQSPTPRPRPARPRRSWTLQYDFTDAAHEEASIVFPFSVTGVDFSQKTLLEVVMLGDPGNNELNFHLGGVNEDADGDGVLDTEDVNGDGILQPSEDIGFLYNPAPASSRALRRRQRQHRLRGPQPRTAASTPTISPATTSATSAQRRQQALRRDRRTPTQRHTTIDFGANGWHTFQIPLNIRTATASRWTAIKQLRISVEGAGANRHRHAVKFARIAVVGNTWLSAAAGDPVHRPGAGNESLTSPPVNTVDNPNYSHLQRGRRRPQVFNDLYGARDPQKQAKSKNLSEQALQLEFDCDLAARARRSTPSGSSPGPWTSASIETSTSWFSATPTRTTCDVTGHQAFLPARGLRPELLRGPGPLTFTGWRKIRIEQTDRNSDSVIGRLAGQGPRDRRRLQRDPQPPAGGRQLAAGVYGAGRAPRDRGSSTSTRSTSPSPSRASARPRSSRPTSRCRAGPPSAASTAPSTATSRPRPRWSPNQDNRQDSAYLNLTPSASSP